VANPFLTSTLYETDVELSSFMQARAQNPRRLSRSTLENMPQSIRRPQFDIDALQSGILHFGCGAFHRGHQALVTQRAIEAGGHEALRWGIASASMVNKTTPQSLAPQDNLYTLIERGNERTHYEVIGSVAETVFVPTDERGLVDRMADPATELVTLTVTSGGYTLDGATGHLNEHHPDIEHDLNANTPKSVIGTLVEGLKAAYHSGRRPPVIISCDNMVGNGETVKQVSVDYAALKDDRLAAWIERSVQFPNTMVDRIVPTLSERDMIDVQKMTGLEDKAPVTAEPYLQWIIEDFEGPRPLWEAGGAEFVGDVTPWETAKLRLLNGTHMALAYVGGLADHATMAEASSDKLLAAYALRFMIEEQAPTLPSGGPDPEAYAQLLLRRWRNPAIHHDVVRIGRNGSEKLDARLLRPLRENLQAGRPASCTILALASWIRWFALRDTSGTKVRLDDPIASRLKDLCEEIGEDHPRLADAFLKLEDVFGPKLPNHDEVAQELGKALSDLHLYEVRDVISARLN